jgi:hypothetical protein
LVQSTPVRGKIEVEWMILQQILKQKSLGSLGHKRKWQRKEGITHWNEHIKQVINDKREAFMKFL